MNNEKIWTSVPRDNDARMELLVERPPAWEYLLFGGAMLLEVKKDESRWRDYCLGYSLSVGPVVARSDLADEVTERMSRARAIVSNLEKVISQGAQQAAFGLPGDAGDPALIEHMAKRLIDIYRQLLSWVEEVRSLRIEGDSGLLQELLAEVVDQPLRETRAFSYDFVESLESALAARIDNPNEPIVINMTIAYELPGDLADRVEQELTRVLTEH